jgi:hypothetical protein
MFLDVPDQVSMVVIATYFVWIQDKNWEHL